MSVGGSAIPRLQDLSYIEVAVDQVAAGATFEQVRRGLVSRAAELARDSDTDGSFDSRRWDLVRADGTKHVHNTVDVLKELMRVGWVDKHNLPSTPSSAYLHSDATFTLTDAGRAWAALAAADRRAAYNQLVGVLADAHPQFKGFLKLVGATKDSLGSHFTIPLLRPTAAAHPTNTAVLRAVIDYATAAAATGQLGWTADGATIDAGITSYVSRFEERLKARGKDVTRKQFVNTCEEAVTRVAFAAAGCPLDYISMELLRRWTRTLGIANFSYYAPGPTAMRLWATATVDVTGPTPAIQRRVGDQVRADALRTLWSEWPDLRADAAGAMYAPIWRVRAAVCWRNRISDDEFDRAITEALAGQHRHLPFQIHLDQASLHATPASTRPLVIATASGVKRVFNVINLVPVALKETS